MNLGLVILITVHKFLGRVYKVTLEVGDMGWVDFDLGSSTILPCYPANEAKSVAGKIRLLLHV